MSNKYLIESVGDLAVILGVVSFMPVVYTVYKTKKTNNFPYKSLFFLIISQMLWVFYVYLVSAKATFVGGTLFSLIYLFILYTKYTN